MEGGEGESQGQVEREGGPLTRDEAVRRLLREDSAGGTQDPFGKEHRYVTIEDDVFVGIVSRDDMPPPLQDAIQHKDMVDLITAAGLAGRTIADQPNFRGGYFVTDGEALVTVGPSTSITAADASVVDRGVNSKEPDASKIYLIDPAAMQKTQAGKAAQ